MKDLRELPVHPSRNSSLVRSPHPPLRTTVGLTQIDLEDHPRVITDSSTVQESLAHKKTSPLPSVTICS
jgi:hypothetical protein